MDKLIVEGGKRLKGSVFISGSKNAALPIMAASLLTDETTVIKGVPHLSDVLTMMRILEWLGAQIRREDDNIIIKPGALNKCKAPYKLVSTMRASFCVLGPLVGKLRKAEVSLPGGCVIGPRPVDLHLKGLKALGTQIKIEGGYVIAKAPRLEGTHIYLGGAYGSSVLATANILMAAVLAHGTTIIENAACEPELVDLVHFLKKMGAKIKGEGSHAIEVTGVRSLHGTTYAIIPDRVEAATYIAAAAITKGDVTLNNVRFDHLGAVVDKFTQAGINIEEIKANTVRVTVPVNLRAADITTLPYPGFPTDMQAQAMAIMSVTDGISIITEKIYPDRFMHISELNRMGAQINLEGPSAIVKGVDRLSGAPVMASDLRASAALVIAGLVAKGKTEVARVYHLDRGYEFIEQKLSRLGAIIFRQKN